MRLKKELFTLTNKFVRFHLRKLNLLQKLGVLNKIVFYTNKKN